MRGLRQGVVAAVAGLAFLSAAPEIARAVVPGTNGTIAFTSGRGAGGDPQSDIYFLNFPVLSSIDPLTSATGQHRHAAWSPDRTEISYALWNGQGGAEDDDLWVHEPPGPSRTRLTIGADDEDRPQWSPDGQKIAYEVGPAPKEIEVIDSDAAIEMPAPLSLTGGSAADEGRPTWSADSQTIFYSRDAAGAPVENDIVREPAVGGAVSFVIGSAMDTNDDYQPMVSPDGTKLCFNRGAFGSNDAEVMTANINGTNIQPVSPDDNVGSYNCAWSPDGEKIAYANGIFMNGALVMRNSDGTGPVQTLTNVSSPALVFDGNPDWAPDGRPTCQDSTAAAKSSVPTAITFRCVDTGPDYEQTAVTESLVTGPQNGTLGPFQPANSSTVEYTADPNFVGTDSFTFTGDDARGPASNQATVTINVTDGTDPVLELGGKKKQSLRKKVKLNASCDEACSVDLDGTLKKGALKPATFDLAPRENPTLKLKLTRKAFKFAEKKVDKGKKVTVNITGVATDTAGNAGDTETFKKKLK